VTRLLLFSYLPVAQKLSYQAKQGGRKWLVFNQTISDENPWGYPKGFDDGLTLAHLAIATQDKSLLKFLSQHLPVPGAPAEPRNDRVDLSAKGSTERTAEELAAFLERTKLYDEYLRPVAATGTQAAARGQAGLEHKLMQQKQHDEMFDEIFAPLLEVRPGCSWHPVLEVLTSWLSGGPTSRSLLTPLLPV
jgi:hypothetical protein